MFGLGGDAGGSDGGRGGVYMSGDTSGGVESVKRCTCQREKQLFSLFVCQVFSSRLSFLLASLFLAVSMRKLQKKQKV